MNLKTTPILKIIANLLSYLLVLIVLTNNAAASQKTSWWEVQEEKRGVLLGVQLGIGFQEPPIEAGFAPSFISILLPFGGRTYVGYQFNQHLAFELGYHGSEISQAKGDYWGDSRYYTYSADLAAKLIYPVNKYVDIYAKPGAALMHQEVYNKVLQTDTTPLADWKVTKIVPEIGVGADLELFNHVIGSLSGNYTFSSGVVNSSFLLATGITIRLG